MKKTGGVGCGVIDCGGCVIVDGKICVIVVVDVVVNGGGCGGNGEFGKWKNGNS